MKIISINIARVGNLFLAEEETPRRIASAIGKRPVNGPVIVGPLGLDGDGQADHSVHGGPLKAVYAYPVEHYAFWEEQRSRLLRRHDPLPPGAMGENLTVQGLPESQVWAGDKLVIGDVVLEVTQPRSPCFKFGIHMGFAHAVKAMAQSGATGFYLKVLHAGVISAGDTVSLRAGPRRQSIAQINEQRYGKGQRDLF